MKKCSTKLWKIMKLCAAQAMIAMVISGVSIAHENYAQLLDKKVTLEVEDVSLEQALYKLQDASEVKIFFSLESLNTEGGNVVSLQAHEETLRKVLDQLLTPYNIKYRVDEKNSSIIILKKENSKPIQSTLSAPTRSIQINTLTNVTGKVTDATTQQPLAGVNIVVKGTTNGTTSDADGKYSVNANENDILVFSFIGYSVIEIKVDNQSVIDINLVEDVKSLNEVVVFSTGYAEETPERTTGSFSNVGKELLERNVGSDLASRLNGVTPSLLVDQRNGNQAFFNIRGRSTIMANDQPLIVVDNFPYNGNINTINPNDIENITVLRDAAAASIWGVRAGNGVIVITTKKGKSGQPLQVNINTNVTIGDKPDLFYEKRISTSDFIDVEKKLFDNGYFDNDITNFTNPSISPVVEILLKGRNGELSEQEVNSRLHALRSNDVRNDLKEYFYRRSVNQQYAVNLSGSTERSSFYTSVGYDKAASNLVGNNQGRLSLNFQNTFRPVKKIQIESRLVYTQTASDVNSTVGSIRMGSRDIYPYAKLTDEFGNPAPITYDYSPTFVNSAESKGFLNWQYNPIEELKYSDNTSKQSNIRTAFGIKYDVAKWLSGEIKYQYENQGLKARILQPIESYFTRNLINSFSNYNGSSVTGYNIPLGGILTHSDQNLESHNGRFQLNASQTWRNHSVIALAGVEVREVGTEGYSYRQYGYDPNLGSSSSVNYDDNFVLYPSNSYATIPNTNGIKGTLDRYRSYFANTSYTFKERYTLYLSGRIDQSNLFGVRTNQKSAPLWSIGGKWVVNAEPFFKMESLPYLSLRATYGYNGNVDQNVTAFTTAQFISAAFSQRNAAFLVNPPNPDLRWEKSGMLNIGIDFSTRRNALSGSIEFYNKDCTDLIGEGPLDPTKGFTSFKGNIASIKGYGWDVQLNSINIDRTFKWRTNFMFSYTTDKVTRYDLRPTSIWDYMRDGSISRITSDYVPVEGKPLFGVYSFSSAGLDPQTGDPRGYLNGEPSANYSAIQSSATIDSLLYHGRATAPVYGALRNTISYRQWSLSLNLSYRFGYYFRSPSISYSNLYSSYKGHQDFAKRWQQPGDEVSTTIPSMVYPGNSLRDAFYLSSETLVERGDNIRIQDIQLAYELADLNVGSVTLTQFQVYAYINNVGMLWKANSRGLDPDFPTLPLPRTYAIGFRFGF
ncbi:MAG: SusC/RagA family TonB-linked outer membrane protein [Cyclobacteriaceae bacterium]|nr:SusC/RagA family TonB-linked outer membrane protein [Cyclobacteriaceae bacterium]